MSVRGYMARVTRDERGAFVVVWLTHDMACRCCGVAHVAFRIRAGRTLCAGCDEQTTEAAHAP